MCFVSALMSVSIRLKHKFDFETNIKFYRDNSILKSSLNISIRVSTVAVLLESICETICSTVPSAAKEYVVVGRF